MTDHFEVKTMLGKRIRHIQRYQEIINAFMRNGFTYFVTDIGLLEMFSTRKKWTRESEINKQKSLGERLRNFFEELGPSFIKLGQLASTRPDLFPIEVIQELEKLQDDVASFSYAEVAEIIETELGKKPSELFSYFSEQPLAAASIGQVHEAILHDETRVAIKIQRPDIKKIIETDLEIVADLARLAENRIEWAKKHKLTDLVNEFSESIGKELDYNLEARNAERIARNSVNDESVFIPAIYWDYTTKKVLTMDFVEGIKINDIDKLNEGNFDNKLLAEHVGHIFLKQILIDGFFHGDPHPGNVFVMDDGRIALLDFGLSGALHPDLKYQFATLLIAFKRRSTDGIMRALYEMDLISLETDTMKLYTEIDHLREKYYDMSFSKIRLGETLNELFTIARNYNIKFPSEFTLLGKVVLTLEGIIEPLDPDISIMQLADPFSKQLMRDRYSVANISKRLLYNTVELTDEISKFPKNLRELMNVLKKGKVQHEMTHPQLDNLLNKFDKVANRLSYSIVLLSFSIIMVGLIIGTSLGHDDALFWRLPVVEIGFIIATLMVIWLLYSIFRSGRWF